VNQWKAHFPWIDPYYSLKANPTNQIIDDLIKLDWNFDFASKGELKLVLGRGANPRRLIYSNPIKSEIDIGYAKKKNVKLTICDTIEEIKKIREIAGDKMKILWSISIDHQESNQLVNRNGIKQTPNKFGDNFNSKDETIEKFKIIKNMGVNLAGIHFHCGKVINNINDNYKFLLDKARASLEIGRNIGHKMEILDIGGGFPGGKINNNLKEALSFTQNDSLGYSTIAEPGRFISSSAFSLAVRIIGKRIKNNKTCYHLNDSLYHSFNCILMDGLSLENKNDLFYNKWSYDSEAQDKININISEEEMKSSSLFGMTCAENDIICKNIYAPNLNVGDWIIFGGMGAYTYGVKSYFNGMKSTEKIITLKDSKIKEVVQPLDFKKLIKRKKLNENDKLN